MTITQLAEHSAHISHTYQITPEVYFCFQRCSNDFNPLHTDAAYANLKGFEKPVMYGNILNAFVSHFIGKTPYHSSCGFVPAIRIALNSL